jgi:hypothetical protein
MTRIGTNLFVVLIVAVPVGLIAGTRQETPERGIEDRASRIARASRVRGTMQEWLAVPRNGPSIMAVPTHWNGTREREAREYDRLVNQVTRKVRIDAGEEFVFATDALGVEGEHRYPLAGETRLVAPMIVK